MLTTRNSCSVELLLPVADAVVFAVLLGTNEPVTSTRLPDHCARSVPVNR